MPHAAPSKTSKMLDPLEHGQSSKMHQSFRMGHARRRQLGRRPVATANDTQSDGDAPPSLYTHLS
jgi:hypothetical protein